jgi:uncharacterized protein YcbX
MPILSGLYLYPIKSCAGIAVSSATVHPAALSAGGVCDREWMLVDQNDRFLTQREYPRMALIVPRIEGGAMMVAAPAMAPLEVALALPDAAARRPVQIWDDSALAFDCGDDAAAWFSQALGVACRLVRCDRTALRHASTRWTNGLAVPVTFSDGYPILVIGAASLADLNQRLVNAGRAALPMDRFRPNLVVNDLDAFEEDYAHSFEAGALCLTPVKPCPRCPIPSVDQATGVPGPDPLDILQSYRAKPQLDGAICFGMNCIVSAGAGHSLRVGDRIEVGLAF